jgi:AcrR family transcriptional regulator
MQLAVPAPDHRSDEILQSVRSMFAEKGFDGASMQDLARATGMSVGNFYRYFPSKAAIVEQMVTRDLAEVSVDFSAVMEAQDSMEALRQKLHERIDIEFCGQDGPLWAEMTAAAFRKPEIAQAMLRMETEITRYLLGVMAKGTGLPLAEVEQRFTAHTGLIMMLIKSSAMVCQTSKKGDLALRDMILRTIDGVLTEISGCAVKG